MSALDDLNSASAALNGVVGVMNTFITNTNAQIAAALAAIDATVKVVWIDAVAGNDANSGATAATAVATLAGAIARVGAGQMGQLILNSDLVVTTAAYSWADIQIISNGARKKITFDPLCVTTAPGNAFQAGLGMGNGRGFQFVGVDIDLGALPGGTVAMRASGLGLFYSVNVTMAAGILGALIAPETRLTVNFSVVTLPVNAPGHIFYGVAAGANPNAQWFYSTNIVSA